MVRSRRCCARTRTSTRRASRAARRGTRRRRPSAEAPARRELRGDVFEHVRTTQPAQLGERGGHLGELVHEAGGRG